MRGFERTSGLLTQRVRRATESRGFSETRVLTHWAEIVGQEIAAIARPVSVNYGRGSFGATLTVLTTGANAPMLQMQEPRLREKVNAVYGYAAISRIRFTQTAPTGFAEGQAQFAPPPPPAPRAPNAACRRRAEDLAGEVCDDSLRKALASLGALVLNKSKRQSETPE
ncbi:hypothetical protein SAMN04488094_107110 [Tropicimonas isoalkanivorans]|uniref:DUF721 domain-containing protein n=2 Tax=Tropicimonas isoalkanivorans TaxID=441112 RepID=A0A1I1KWB1_9RHOB|nr:hypothetical protein SAMN04488094_107110 [Tropicimonas isoalkanivorans]